MVKVMPENTKTPTLETFLAVFPEFENYGKERCGYFLSQAIDSVPDGLRSYVVCSASLDHLRKRRGYERKGNRAETPDSLEGGRFCECVL